MGRPPLEEPGRLHEAGRLLQCGQGRVRGGNDHSHLLGRGRRSSLSLPLIPPPEGPQHQPCLETQGARASRQRAFPVTCAGEWAPAVPHFGEPPPRNAPSSLHIPGALIFPLLLFKPPFSASGLRPVLESLKWRIDSVPHFPPLPSGLLSSPRRGSSRAGQAGYLQGNGAVRQKAGLGRLREVPAAAHHPPARRAGGAAA